MELKDYLRALVQREGKMSVDSIIDQLEEAANEGRYETYFMCDDVLDVDMFELRKRGLEIEIDRSNEFFSTRWIVRW